MSKWFGSCIELERVALIIITTTTTTTIIFLICYACSAQVRNKMGTTENRGKKRLPKG